MPDECLDLVVSSPPYNLGKEYESRQALEIYLAEQTAVLLECSRILKNTGSLFWQVGAFSDRGMLIPLDIRFFPILESCRLIPRNRIIWARQHGLHAQKKFSCRHETILWFTYLFSSDRFINNNYPHESTIRIAISGIFFLHFPILGQFIYIH
ncbi:MAG: DNA methyltransferase [Nostoc sp.]|uniref:DNA methyltransferase n=1 Tax=Nostoc sp. TaxID=1180 RepID=UPI002FFC52E9